MRDKLFDSRFIHAIFLVALMVLVPLIAAVVPIVTSRTIDATVTEVSRTSTSIRTVFTVECDHRIFIYRIDGSSVGTLPRVGGRYRFKVSGISLDALSIYQEIDAVERIF